LGRRRRAAGRDHNDHEKDDRNRDREPDERGRRTDVVDHPPKFIPKSRDDSEGTEVSTSAGYRRRLGSVVPHRSDGFGCQTELSQSIN
jgi:hypothetical protein